MEIYTDYERITFFFIVIGYTRLRQTFSDIITSSGINIDLKNNYMQVPFSVVEQQLENTDILCPFDSIHLKLFCHPQSLSYAMQASL